MPAAPKAALGMYTTDLDILITLGIPLAKSQPIRDDGYTSFPYFFDQAALEGITPFNNYPEFNYEAILTAQPDVILNGLGYEKDLDAKLSEIAPTYTFNGFDGSDWRTKFKTVAEAFGKTDEYNDWMAKYQSKVDDIKKRLAEAGKNPVVGPIDYYENQVSATCYGTPCLVFKDLGLRITPLTDGEGTYLSTEQLEQLNDVDVAFTTAVPETDTGVDGDAFTPLEGNKLWTALPFVANQEIHTYDLEMLYGSPSGQYAFLETVEKALLP
ncbi:MAG: ABC-type Fe3+-hydroxamate transporter, extracellular iron-siderophore binding protein [Pseudarthrobacter sp.]|nr:ABC-type Fe3+-hydroxamate transporter, extracellular iron-siderophore binding protein [Pseudarthrobacter sp.]